MDKIPGKPEEYLGWATGSSTDAQDFSNLVVSANFWKEWGDKIESLTTDEAVQRALAGAKFVALERLYDIRDLPERSSTLLIMDAKKNGWHHLLPAEYTSLGDLLSGIANKISDDNESSKVDLQFTVEQFLPALARAGVDVDKLLDLRDNWSKCRVAIPHVRVGLDEMEGQELSEFLKEMIDMIVDPDVSVRDMRKELKQNGHKDHPTIESKVYQVGKGKYVYVAIVNDDGLNWLAKVLKFTIVDVLKPFSKFIEFLKEIT